MQKHLWFVVVALGALGYGFGVIGSQLWSSTDSPSPGAHPTTVPHDVADSDNAKAVAKRVPGEPFKRSKLRRQS